MREKNCKNFVEFYLRLNWSNKTKQKRCAHFKTNEALNFFPTFRQRAIFQNFSGILSFKNFGLKT